MLVAYLLLIVGVVTEVLGTVFLKLSEGFTKPIPVIATVISIVLTAYLSSLILKLLPLGIAYAFWAGMGIVLTFLIGVFKFKEILDLPAIIGIVLIILGIIIIQLFSKSIN